LVLAALGDAVDGLVSLGLAAALPPAPPALLP
jgi:hypothetical protein